MKSSPSTDRRRCRRPSTGRATSVVCFDGLVGQRTERETIPIALPAEVARHDSDLHFFGVSTPAQLGPMRREADPTAPASP